MGQGQSLRKWISGLLAVLICILIGFCLYIFYPNRNDARNLPVAPSENAQTTASDASADENANTSSNAEKASSVKTSSADVPNSTHQTAPLEDSISNEALDIASARFDANVQIQDGIVEEIINPDRDLTQEQALPSEAVDDAAGNGLADAAGLETADHMAGNIDFEPSFDLVRVPSDGFATIAGRAAVGSQIVLYLDDGEIARAKADNTGQFVILTEILPSPNSRVLSLLSQFGGKEIYAKEPIIILPTQNLQASAKPQALDQIEAAPSDEQPKPIAEPRIAKATTEGLEILSQSAADTEVFIDAISYDEQGRVFASGRAAQNTILRAYIDDNFLIEFFANNDGQWRQELIGLSAGTHRMRLDSVDTSGQVVARSELEFEREIFEQIAQNLPSDSAASNGEATQIAPLEQGDETLSNSLSQAQPLTDAEQTQSTPSSNSSVKILSHRINKGDTLWAIARKNYGDGLLYVRLFDANKAKITDPDLIYPGQIINIPQ